MNDEVKRLRNLCAEMYQIVGSATYLLGIFDTDDAIKPLDNLSAGAEGEPLPHDDLLPWPSKPIKDLQSEAQKQDEVLFQRLTEGLVYLYKQDDAKIFVAELCDKYLDRSGAMLGRIRDEAID